MIRNQRYRWLGVAMALLLVILIMAGALYLPWGYPSSTLLYKFGFERLMLMAGKMAGIGALVLMIVQLVLAARLPVLEKILGQNTLILVHGFVGGSVASLALLHPLLIFAYDDLTVIPLDLDLWPEVLGGFLLLGIIISAAFVWWREFTRLPYHLWKLFHGYLTPLFIGGALAHCYFVADSYQQGPPFLFVLGAGIVSLGLLLWIHLGKRLRGVLHYVDSVKPVGKDAHELRLKPAKRKVTHAPGQFALISPISSTLSAEEHPFTIVSTPDEKDLRFIVRCSGDWTSRLGALKPGDTVNVQGSYGLFSHLAYPQPEHLVCIAGGVGATPLLSMMRSLGDEDPPVLFVWSNRTREDLFAEQTLATITANNPINKIVYLFSREKGQDKENELYGRLDKQKLEHVLQNVPIQSALFFVCGPPAMIQSVVKDLRSLGVRRTKVKTEVFAL